MCMCIADLNYSEREIAISEIISVEINFTCTYEIFEFIFDCRHLPRQNGTSEIFEEVGASIFVTWHMTGSMTVHHYCALYYCVGGRRHIYKKSTYSRYILSATVRCVPNLYCANYTRLVVAQFVTRDKE